MMRKAGIAVIGGTGIESFLRTGTKMRVGTPYGPSSVITLGRIGSKNIAFLPRHGEKHSIPPHKINYLANIFALHKLNVERILAANAVGAVNLNYRPGDLVIPSDFIDFTKSRPQTFYDRTPVMHVDPSDLYCPELRKILLRSAEKRLKRVWDDAVYLCTEGPRYESPAEIRMFRGFGCDVVGMTGLPEAVLARELRICYATLCFVSNMAAGIRGKLSAEEIMDKGRSFGGLVKEILMETVENIPRKRSCPCSSALEGARV